MTQTSVALPRWLLDDLTNLAQRERRSRNNFIQLILEDAVKLWSTQNNLKAAEPRASRAYRSEPPEEPPKRDPSA